ncbi:hypothetical protein [Protofrankia symbiont of Coriaria ruscifolia]|nr:hypothetical protein [Protofrankia symbiont of Coriaria ruscifolia]
MRAVRTTTAALHARTVVRLDRPAEAAAFRADPDAALSGPIVRGIVQVR